MREQKFEHWISKIKISAKTENHFIVLGSDGTNAVKYLRSEWEKGRYTAVNKPEDASSGRNRASENG